MGQKIQQIKVKNFKCLSSEEVLLNGSSVYLIAPNANGKTSFIDAAFGMMPDKPLKDGAKRGMVEIILNDYVCQFKFTDKKQKASLNIFDRSGQQQKRPAELFKSLFGVQDFNIESFLLLSPAKRVEMIKGIIGIDWEDVDQRVKEIKSEKTFLTRTAKEADNKIGDRIFDPSLVEIDIEPIQQEFKKAIDLNNNIDRINQVITQKLKEVIELQDKLSLLSDEIKKGTQWLEGKEKIDITALQLEINQGIQSNKDVQFNIENGKLREESGALWEKIEKIDTELEEIADTKKTELENSPLPIEGLEFDGEILLLDNQPFESDQINTARKIIAGLELQYHLLNDVRIARLDASLLDKKSMKTVHEWAAKRDIQLFIELVDHDGDELKIEIEQEG